jgi:hypothetical protein
MVIEEQVFKNKPIMVIKNEKGRIFFSAGLTKIKLILENIETLKAFVDKHNEPKEPII